jgi:hypothetical protein
MHETSIYHVDELDLDNLDFKILKGIINPLKEGTEIEKFLSPTEATLVNKFKFRVLRRIKDLAGDLKAKGLIEEVGQEKERELRKTQIFLNHWKNKSSFWAPKTPSKKKLSSPAKVSKEPNIYDMETEPSDNDTLAVAEALKPSSKVTRKVNALYSSRGTDEACLPI